MKKAAKVVSGKSDLMSVGELFDYVTDNVCVVDVPGWGKKIEIKRMTLAQMIALKDAPEADQERIMLSHALGLSDANIKKLKDQNDGIKYAQLMQAINQAYAVTDDLVKK
jgi:hypothetical protein